MLVSKTRVAPIRMTCGSGLDFLHRGRRAYFVLQYSMVPYVANCIRGIFVTIEKNVDRSTSFMGLKLSSLVSLVKYKFDSRVKRQLFLMT